MKFLDIVERGYHGEECDKETWDLDYIAIKTAEIVADRELSWDKERITGNFAEAREFYEAGRELLLATGVYNMNTGRIIKLTEEEIDEAAKNQLKSIVMGKGDDAFELYARKPEDKRKPAVFAGNPGCPTPEKYFKQYVKSCAQEKAVDLLTCGSLCDVDGFAVTAGEPSEIYAVRREIKYLNEASKEVGRPGLGRLTAESAVSEIGDLAASGLIRATDSHLVALNNELITTKDNLLRAANSDGMDMINASLACVMVGGMAGGAPGAAVCMIASMLAANIICRADYHLCHPIHIYYIATSTRECMWLQNIVLQAFAECAPNIIVCDIYPKSGALTKELLYEVAANALSATVSGGHLEGVGACDGLKPHGTGLEARLMGEVARAATECGMTRDEANGIILALLEKYEPILKTGNEGKPFDEAYDVDSVKPVAEWQAMYDEVVEELAALGLKI